MLHFLSQLHWYEILFGGLATIVVIFAAFSAFMDALVTFLFAFFTSQRVQTITCWSVLVGAVVYLTYLVTKYT